MSQTTLVSGREATGAESQAAAGARCAASGTREQPGYRVPRTTIALDTWY